MSKIEMHAAVRIFAGTWVSDVGDVYCDAADELVEHGYSREDAVELLGDLYQAAASEYGA